MAERRASTAVWIATCGGTGYLPVAPGTAASAAACVLVAFAAFQPFPLAWTRAILSALAVAVFAIGVWAAGSAEAFFGRPDPAQVVIDELAGQLMTFLAEPDFRWKWLIIGFGLFRILDVLKPFPAGRAERAAGGWGIMLDDLVAGVYSLVGLRMLRLVLK